MYRPDHLPPRFQAQYGEHVAQVELDTLQVIAGSLPTRALRLVVEWAKLHPQELQSNWELRPTSGRSALIGNLARSPGPTAWTQPPSSCTIPSASPSCVQALRLAPSRSPHPLLDLRGAWKLILFGAGACRRDGQDSQTQTFRSTGWSANHRHTSGALLQLVIVQLQLARA